MIWIFIALLIIAVNLVVMLKYWLWRKTNGK